MRMVGWYIFVEKSVQRKNMKKYRYRGAIFSFKVFLGITMVWVHYHMIQAWGMLIYDHIGLGTF